MHVWVVISDPQLNSDSVLLVSFTSNKCWQDQSCVLQPGDHPYLTKETVLFYAKAKLMPDVELDSMLAAGEIMLDDPLNAKVLAAIREGARISKRIANRHRQVLVDQKLITA